MNQQQQIFKSVPFNQQWAIPGTKYDLKAIYRRPRRTVDEFDRIVQAIGEDGLPLWDLVGPLPLRRHGDWAAKGFEYVTVVVSTNSAEGLMEFNQKIAPWLRERGLNPGEFIQHPQLGTWNPKMYMATAEELDRRSLAELVALVHQFGSAAVEQIKRTADPHFVLPAKLQNIPAPGAAPAPVAEQTTGTASEGTNVAAGAETPRRASKPRKKKPEVAPV